MRRYRNRLQRVLDVRRVQEERAKAEVRQARAEAALADLVARSRIETYRGHELPVGPIPYVGHRIERSLYELKGLIALDAQQRRDVAHEQVEARLNAWVETRRRVDAMERLDQRRRHEHQVEVDRADERQVDDMVTGRAGRAGRGDDGIGAGRERPGGQEPLTP